MERDITIPANGVFVWTVPPSSVFFCISTDGVFKVQPDERHKFSVRAAGKAFGNEGGRPWSTLTFFNSTGIDITATVYSGTTDYGGSAETLNTVQVTQGADAGASNKVVKVLVGSGVIEAVSAAATYIAACWIYPAKAVAADGTLTPNLNAINIGHNATVLPDKREVADTNFPVFYSFENLGKKVLLSDLHVSGTAGDGVVVVYIPA